MENERTSENEIYVRHIYNIQMLHYTDRFILESTYNDDWRMLCMYHGEAESIINNEWVSLVTGNLVLIPPDVSYGLRTKGQNNPQILLITLACGGTRIHELTNEPHRISQANFALLNDIISEAKYAFNLDPNSRQYDHYLPNRSISSSTRQILKNKLELFLLGLFDQRQHSIDLLQESPTVMLSKQILIDRINEYFLSHLSGNITLQELSEELNFSSSYLNSVFRAATGQSIISAFTEMKINQAKIYLEKNNYSVTQIAECLGFSSVHYFSRVFKKTVGISPSEYLEQLNQQRRTGHYE